MRFVKQVRDPVLGWIRLTEGEVRLIDCCAFIQRLRYVMQLGLAHLVYPTAKHTRFDHCLGVMHLATKMFQSLLDQPVFRQNMSKLLDVLGLRDQKISGLLQHVRVAALLHDVGHYPFSHSLDNFLAPLLYEALVRDPELQADLKLTNDSVEVLRILSYGLTVAKEHEWITYFLLTRNSDLIRCISESMPELDLNVIKDILFIDMFSRLCKVSFKKVNYVPDLERVEKYARDDVVLIRLVSSIISSSLDTDRIDYMLRDLYFTGASVSTNITLSDVERILSNIYVTQDKDGQVVVVFDEKARVCLEGFVIARYNLYKWVYLHHKVTLMTTLMRQLYTLLLSNIRMLLDEPLVKKHIEDLALFSTGVIDCKRVLELTDSYVYTMLSICYDKLVKVLGKTGQYVLDSLLYRRPCFKSLWKRDFEFENVLNSTAATEPSVFNKKVGILIYESSKTPSIMFSLQEAFKTRLINEIMLALRTGLVSDEATRRCLERLAEYIDREFTSIIMLGYACFEPDVSIAIASGSENIVDLMELSPLVKAVREAWERSPKLFVYVNSEELKSLCENCDEKELLETLRRCAILALESAVRDVIHAHMKAHAHPHPKA